MHSPRIRLSLGLAAFLLASCGADAPPSAPGGEAPVSDDPVIRAAFKACFEEMSAEVLADNPDTPAELQSALVEGARLACESAVVQTCERGRDTQSCRLMLEMYSG